MKLYVDWVLRVCRKINPEWPELRNKIFWVSREKKKIKSFIRERKPDCHQIFDVMLYA